MCWRLLMERPMNGSGWGLLLSLREPGIAQQEVTAVVHVHQGVAGWYANVAHANLAGAELSDIEIGVLGRVSNVRRVRFRGDRIRGYYRKRLPRPRR